MGIPFSKIKKRHGVNYHCPVCKKTNKPPNLVGKFVLINDLHFQCSGCNALFNKSSIISFYSYKEPITAEHVIKV